MEKGALCVICGGPALPAHTCQLCGALICSKDFNPGKGICGRCSAKSEADTGEDHLDM